MISTLTSVFIPFLWMIMYPRTHFIPDTGLKMCELELRELVIIFRQWGNVVWSLGEWRAENSR